MLKLKNKNILIYGLAKSGIAAANLLTKKEANVYLYDDCKFTTSNVKQAGLVPTSCELLFRFDEELFKFIDLIVISPSVSIYSENIKKAQLHDVKVISELELAYLLSGGKILALTGTNGKTTTVKLIEHILKIAQKKALAVGNIGFAFSDALLLKNPPKTFIVEVSSFQLEATELFSADIVAVLNITPEHMDRHYTFENYISQKAKIFDNTSKKSFLILNADDEQSMALLDRIKQGNTYFYSTKKNIPQGVFIKDEQVFFKNQHQIAKLFNLSDFKLLGEHNLSNALCAVLMCYLHKIAIKYIKEGIKTFKLPPHRLNFVKKVRGVSYYNDSKATNIDACLKAINSFDKKVVLFLGGSDKSEDYKLLFKKLPKNVVHIIVCGQNAKKILASAKKFKSQKLQEVYSLEQAVVVAGKVAKKNQVVLLAPASASFDSFKNYEHRGEEFEKFVKEL